MLAHCTFFLLLLLQLLLFCSLVGSYPPELSCMLRIQPFISLFLDLSIVFQPLISPSLRPSYRVQSSGMPTSMSYAATWKHSTWPATASKDRETTSEKLGFSYSLWLHSWHPSKVVSHVTSHSLLLQILSWDGSFHRKSCVNVCVVLLIVWIILLASKFHFPNRIISLNLLV